MKINRTLHMFNCLSVTFILAVSQASYSLKKHKSGKKMMSLILASVFSINSLALAGIPVTTQNQEIQMSQERVNAMSKEELLNALEEISVAVALLKQDLAEAKEVNGERKVAVHIRNVSLSVAAISVLVIVGAMKFAPRPDHGALSGLGGGVTILVSGATLIGGVVGVLTAILKGDHLFLNKDEVPGIQAKLDKLESTMKSIKAKL